MTYTLLKYGSWEKSREQVYSIFQKLYDIRHIFHVSAWYCASHMTGAATAEAKDVIDKGGELAALRERLDSEFLDYRWSVVEYDKDWDHELDSIQCGSEKVSLVATNVPDVGSDFIKVSTGVTAVRHFLLMYEYSESPKADCKQIVDTRNKIYVKLKNKFTDVASGPNMLSHGSCPSYIRSIAVKAAATQNKVCEVRAPKPGEYLENFYFFATGMGVRNNPCLSSSRCNDHGVCRNLPHTNQYFCQCDRFYDGDFCQTYVVPSSDDAVAKVVATLRLSSATFLGVPDAIDVYYSIMDISKKLDEIKTGIINNIQHLQNIAVGGETWKMVTYITKQYQSFQAMNLTKELFAKEVNRDFSYIVSSFHSLVIGEVFGQETDWMTSYKKQLASNLGSQTCTAAYVQKTSLMRKNIMAIDHTLAEAWIWVLHYNTKLLAQADQVKELAVIDRKRLNSKERLSKYTSRWNLRSCPVLSAPDLAQQCTNQDSYQNMVITLRCNDNKDPVDPAGNKLASVECVLSDGKLAWSAQPSCVYLWSAWGSWSGCSVTCGGGVNTRTRTKKDGSSDSSTRACVQTNTMVKCCSATFGKWECANKNCIYQLDQCEGWNNCGDNSDEPSSCPYFHSGNNVALQSMSDESQWLDGSNTDTTTQGKYMGTSKTPKCGSCKFSIFGVSRREGSAIMHEDKVGFRYSWQSGTGWWLSCQQHVYTPPWGYRFGYESRVSIVSTRCKSRNCPGENMYGKSGCQGEIFTVKMEGGQWYRGFSVIADKSVVRLYHASGKCLVNGGQMDIDSCDKASTRWRLHRV